MYLRPWGSGVKQSRRCVCEPTLRHGMVSLQRCFNIILVYSNRNSHEHVLGPLDNFAVHLQKIRPFQCLEPEVVVVEISVIDYLAVQPSSILIEPIVNTIRSLFEEPDDDKCLLEEGTYLTLIIMS